MAISNITRTVKLAVVVNGSIYSLTTSSATLATNGSGALSATKLVYSQAAFGKLYYVDGTNYKILTPSTNTVSTWTASAGTLPASGANTARLITLWGGRVVLGGVIGDEHNYAMSAIGAPLDFDDAPANPTATTAVSGSSATAGLLGDALTCLLPYNDDLLIMGCDHEIWQMSGNPAAGASLDRISDTIGMAWGRSACRNDVGTIYFAGSRGGIYRMVPGSYPDRITETRIDERLADINVSTHIFRLVWNDRAQGVHVFVSPLDKTAATTHFFYDERADAWTPDVFTSVNHNPIAVHLFDGDDPSDRAILLGGRDGKVRKLDVDESGDDGEEIDSYVMIGPLAVDGKRFILSSLQGTLAEGSDDVDCTIHAGNSAEEAALADSSYECVLTAGRSPVHYPRVSGIVMYVKLRNTAVDQHWSLEKLRATVSVPKYAKGIQV